MEVLFSEWAVVDTGGCCSGGDGAFQKSKL